MSFFVSVHWRQCFVVIEGFSRKQNKGWHTKIAQVYYRIITQVMFWAHRLFFFFLLKVSQEQLTLLCQDK